MYKKDTIELIGKTASAVLTVNESNTADKVGSGSLEVFSTPMMIALMERAACECICDVLEQGQTSVGTEINVSHIAASPIGSEITATAVITCVSGRKIEFLVEARDNIGQIGKGIHTRFVVGQEKFMLKAVERQTGKA